MSCDNPLCPVCRIAAIVRECAESGIPPDALMSVVMQIIYEAYEAPEEFEPEEGTVH